MATSGIPDKMGIGGLSSPRAAASTVLFRIGERLGVVVAGLVSFSFFGLAAAQGNTTTGTKPGTLGNGNVDFVPTPSNDRTTIDDVNWMTRQFNFTSYRQAGDAIRSGTRRECFGNLSLALGSIGPIASVSSSGASGALTLLPTAGALIGGPGQGALDPVQAGTHRRRALDAALPRRQHRSQHGGRVRTRGLQLRRRHRHSQRQR
ncbi:hypothetical protein B0T18DRAFT_231385 [Schizothecium vesticola]|uniref:Uncharacterized protein n=1 Tax=Schizothecium vesticola TaxID=314040 RepID=A0AA40ELG8_9PEZI|nr:hypothetical protein B0T18DRAFT_231385 [Schizothecium vesticola]